MKEQLINLLKNSYSPYSNFRVASIAVMKDGKQFKGVNVENASYGACICAERSAIVSAISNGYKETLTLDRIDNNKGYCPSNCRWITPKEQSNNRRNNVYYTFNGETKTSKQWCELYNISQTTLSDRLKRGWTLEQALTISTKGNHRKKHTIK